MMEKHIILSLFQQDGNSLQVYDDDDGDNSGLLCIK